MKMEIKFEGGIAFVEKRCGDKDRRYLMENGQRRLLWTATLPNGEKIAEELTEKRMRDRVCEVFTHRSYLESQVVAIKVENLEERRFSAVRRKFDEKNFSESICRMK